MQNARQLVIVQEDDPSTDAAGATTWWSLSGDVNRTDLVEALKAHDLLDHMPRVVEPETALGRAVATLRGKRRIVRSVRRGKWAVVEEALDVTRDELRHWDGPTVELDKIGRAVLKNASSQEADAVREAYDYALDVLDTNDISTWLLTAVESLGGLGLRRGGGIYYVPPASIEKWRRFIEVLKHVSPRSSVYTIPTFKITADGARALLDSLTAEIESEVTRITADVVSGDFGVKGLDNRASQSTALRVKLVQYEELLDTRVDRLRDQLSKLDVDLAAARLAAEALRDEQDVAK